MPANSAVYSLAFSPDGKTLASGTLNGSVILWDTALRQPIGEPLTGHGNWINSVAFSPDGKTLASAGADSIVILWNVDPQAWVDHSCQRAGSNFTRDEWAVHFPDEEYHQTCDMWLLESEQPLVVEAVTETQVQEIDTATAQPAPITATAEATQSTASTSALATLPVEDPSFYTEEFDGSFDPWHSFMTTGIERQVNMGIDNGSLALQLKPFEDKVPRFYLTNEAFDYTDVQVEVVVTNNGNNANGVSVICRYSDRGWYEFRLSNAGLYSIDSYDPSMKTYTELASGGSSAIKTGHATNVYTAICKGQELSIHVNGIPIKTITDTKFNLTEGKIGIGVSSPQTLPVDIQFESVTVSKPE